MEIDHDLHQVKEKLPPLVERLDWLMYMRWLVDERRMEHPAAGEPSGEIVEILGNQYLPFMEARVEELAERMKRPYETE